MSPAPPCRQSRHWRCNIASQRRRRRVIMRKHLSLAVVAGAALLVASSAQASVIWFSPLNPTAAAPTTLGQYTMQQFGDDLRPNGGVVSDVPSPLGGVVGFSPDVTHTEVGAGWATWSHG